MRSKFLSDLEESTILIFRKIKEELSNRGMNHWAAGMKLRDREFAINLPLKKVESQSSARKTDNQAGKQEEASVDGRKHGETSEASVSKRRKATRSTHKCVQRAATLRVRREKSVSVRVISAGRPDERTLLSYTHFGEISRA